MINIEIGDKKYKVREAKTESEQEKGLQGVESLPKDEGMLFYFDPPQEVSMWMKDTLIPLDIIFINDDQEVVAIYQAEPNDDDLMTEEDIAYVLEVNKDSGIEEGDELDFEDDDDYVMKVLDQNGNTQLKLKGGERIISRRETKILIKKAKLAESVKNNITQFDNKCKSLGRYIFKVIKGQDERPPEYVKSEDSNKEK